MDIIEFLDDRYREDARPRKRQRVEAPVSEEIIEVFDSDDELPPQTQLSVFSRPPSSQPQVVQRQVPQVPMPLFLPDYDERPQAGPSGPPLLHPGPDERPAPQEARLPRREAAVFLPAPPSQPGAESEDEPDQLGGYVAQVLEIIPDVDPAHALALLIQYYPDYKDKVVEPVLHVLFENPKYPKLEKGKGKRKRSEGDEGAGTDGAGVLDKGKGKEKKQNEVDYSRKDRARNGGVHYLDLALDQLGQDFPLVPKPYLRQTLSRENGLYVPAYFQLVEDQKRVPLPYKPIASVRHRHKGKSVARVDEEFSREREWLLWKVQSDKAAQDAEVAEQLRDQECIEAEGGVECGCCFSENPFDKMVQCPEAHLFCSSCMTQYAETLLGSHDPKIVCMDQSGCKLPFPESELRRFLSPKLISLYERVKQQKEIEAAGLEGLEECPFCEYKVVIENDQEKLFRCENTECGVVSCRSCKKMDHLPKSCKEVEDDKKLDGRHAVEEAMTRALMRNCPKCQKAFVKETGCNKMTCPHCTTLSCYVCRQIIIGYDHFNQQPPGTTGPPKPSDKGKCLLWDSVEQRHADEVAEAAKRAIEEYKREHPDAEDKDLQVELPKAPAPGASNARAMHVPPPIPIPLPLPLPRNIQARHMVHQAPYIPPAIPPLPIHHHHHHHHPQGLAARLDGVHQAVHRAFLPQVHVVHHGQQNPIFNVHLNFQQPPAPVPAQNLPLPLPPQQLVLPQPRPFPQIHRQVHPAQAILDVPRRAKAPPKPRKRKR